MADVKITALAAKGNIEDDDLLVIVDDPGGVPVTKSVTVANAKAGILGGHVILSATHTDTLADTVVRGDIIYGNSTPKWARLAVGAAHSILWTDGTDVSWSASPEIANIADTSGNTRITNAAAAPHVVLTGDVQTSATISVAGSSIVATRMINITHSYTGSAYVGVEIRPTITLNASNASIYGLEAYPTVSLTATPFNINLLRGLFLHAQLTSGAAGATVTEFTAVYGQCVLTNPTCTITNLYGLNISSFKSGVATGLTVTTSYGIKIFDMTVSSPAGWTTAYGLRIEDQNDAAPTDEYLLWIGTSPYLRLDGAGTWTAAANETPLWVTEGAGPTLRQVKWMDPGAGGANFAGGEKVMYLA